MEFQITDYHIRDIADYKDCEIANIDILRRYVKRKMFKESEKNGHEYLNAFIKLMLYITNNEKCGLKRRR